MRREREERGQLRPAWISQCSEGRTEERREGLGKYGLKANLIKRTNSFALRHVDPASWANTTNNKENRLCDTATTVVRNMRSLFRHQCDNIRLGCTGRRTGIIVRIKWEPRPALNIT